MTSEDALHAALEYLENDRGCLYESVSTADGRIPDADDWTSLEQLDELIWKCRMALGMSKYSVDATALARMRTLPREAELELRGTTVGELARRLYPRPKFAIDCALPQDFVGELQEVGVAAPGRFVTVYRDGSDCPSGFGEIAPLTVEAKSDLQRYRLNVIR